MKNALSVLFLSSLVAGTASAQTLSVNGAVDYANSVAYQATITPVTSIDGVTSITRIQPNRAPETAPKSPKADGYRNIAFGIYGGANSTHFSGEDFNGDRLGGRLGYQFGAFVRAGGRVYGQLGAEFFASSSEYFVRGNGASVSDIRDKINTKYLQIPVYIGYKLLESDRGLSAIRLQVGAEYANRLSSDSNAFDLNTSTFKSGTFNGLGQVGFDIGPLLIDLTYHHGFSDSIQDNTGFAGSKRRIFSASVGLKF